MDNKKYYYMRLKDNFYDTNELVLLESLQDGYLYSNILLKLYLRSLKDNGKLMFNDRIPYNPQMIATITRHQVGTVERALKLFQEMGLIEILDNGAIYMLDIQNYIGTSSSEADRVKLYRSKISEEKVLENTIGVQMYDKRTPEIEIELDIEKEIKKDIEKDIEKKKDSKRFSKPSIEELSSYIEENNYNVDSQRFMDYYESNGWKVGKNSMKDWKATVRTWNSSSKKDTMSKAKPTPQKPFRKVEEVPNYTTEEVQQVDMEDLKKRLEAIRAKRVL